MDTEGFSISWEIAERLVKLAKTKRRDLMWFVLALAQIRTISKISGKQEKIDEALKECSALLPLIFTVSYRIIIIREGW